MTNWFKKLNITANEMRNFFKEYIEKDNWFVEFKDNNYCVNRTVGEPGECGCSTEYYSCSPFFIKEMFSRRPLNKIDEYMKLASEKDNWNFQNRLTTSDFSSTPRAYYELILSKCSNEEKVQYMQELKEEYNKCIKDEIKMLEEKSNEIKTQFDKEILARKRMLVNTPNNFSTNKQFAKHKTSKNNEDIENE